jgi:hypothetical protein
MHFKSAAIIVTVIALAFIGAGLFLPMLGTKGPAPHVEQIMATKAATRMLLSLTEVDDRNHFLATDAITTKEWLQNNDLKKHHIQVCENLINQNTSNSN